MPVTACRRPASGGAFESLRAASSICGCLVSLGLASPLVAAPQAGTDAAPRDSSASAEAPVVVPLVELRHGQVDIVWQRSGPERRLEAVAVLREPVLRVLRQREQTQAEEPAQPLPGTGEAVREPMPLPVEADRIEVHDMRVVFVDETVPDKEILTIQQLDLMIENYSTRRAASRGLPTLVTGSGRIGRDGRLSLFVTLNPWTGELDFAGRAQVTGLGLQDLAGFVEEKIDLVPVQGSLAAFAEFSVHDGYIAGGVKPILSNAQVAPADPGLVDRVKNWLVQGALDLFSDDVPRRQAVAAVVPLSGRVDDPNADVWDTLVSVLQNAFIDAITAGFESVPPSSG